MKYYEKYLDCGKEIVLTGIGFDLEKRNIDNYLLETLPLSLSPDSTRKIKYLSPSSLLSTTMKSKKILCPILASQS
jgi:hypothetical protein